LIYRHSPCGFVLVGFKNNNNNNNTGGGIRPIAAGLMLRRLASKCDRSAVSLLERLRSDSTWSVGLGHAWWL